MNTLTEILFGKFVPPLVPTRRIDNMGMNEKDVAMRPSKFGLSQRDAVMQFLKNDGGWLKAPAISMGVDVSATNVRYHLQYFIKRGLVTKKYRKEGRTYCNFYKWGKFDPNENE